MAKLAPKLAQTGPQDDQVGTQDCQVGAQDGQVGAQDGPLDAQDGQKTANLAPKTAKLVFKMAKLRPRWPSWRPRWPSWRPRRRSWPANVIVNETIPNLQTQRDDEAMQRRRQRNQSKPPANSTERERYQTPSSPKRIQNLCKGYQTAVPTRNQCRWNRREHTSINIFRDDIKKTFDIKKLLMISN